MVTDGPRRPASALTMPTASALHHHTSSPDSRRPRRAPVRHRAYDFPVLEWVITHRVVTLHQVLTRFWYLDAKNPQHGYRVVRALARRGLVALSPLAPHKGSVSRQLVVATPAARQLFGFAPCRDPLTEPRATLYYRLQVAQLDLELAVGDYLEAPPEDAWDALRDAALDDLRARGICNDLDRLMADRIRRAPARTIPGAVWVDARGRAQIVLGHRTRARFQRAVQALPDLRILEPLRFTIATWDTRDGPKAEAGLRRHLERQGYRRFTIDVPASFLALRNPAWLPRLTRSRYEEHGAPNPRRRSLLAPPHD